MVNSLKDLSVRMTGVAKKFAALFEVKFYMIKFEISLLQTSNKYPNE